MRKFVFAVVLMMMVPEFLAADEYTRTPQIKSATQGQVTNTYVVGQGSWAEAIGAAQKLRQAPYNDDPAITENLRRTKNDASSPPVFLLELARRNCADDPEQAAYDFALANIRMRYDAFRCVDKTARGGVTMSMIALPLKECKAAFSKERMIRVQKEIRNSDELFDYASSPWWLCSHGMAATEAAMANQTLERDDWLRPESAFPAIQAKLIEMIDQGIAKHEK